jgi:hypothetical protein
VKNRIIKLVNPQVRFNPVLFWDAENINSEKHSTYIIARVLDYGDEHDVKKLRKLYPDKKLKEVITKRRGLMPKTGKFWAIYFNIPLQEIACLKKYYPKTLSG